MPKGGISASISVSRFRTAVSGFPTGFPLRSVSIISLTGIPNLTVPADLVSDGLNSRTVSPLSVIYAAEISYPVFPESMKDAVFMPAPFCMSQMSGSFHARLSSYIPASCQSPE